MQLQKMLLLLSTFFIIGSSATKYELGEEIPFSFKKGPSFDMKIMEFLYEEHEEVEKQLWCVQANFFETGNKTPQIDFLLRLDSLLVSFKLMHYIPLTVTPRRTRRTYFH